MIVNSRNTNQKFYHVQVFTFHFSAGVCFEYSNGSGYRLNFIREGDHYNFKGCGCFFADPSIN